MATVKFIAADINVYQRIVDGLRPFLDRHFDDWSVDIGFSNRTKGKDRPCEVVSYGKPITAVQARELQSRIKKLGGQIRTGSKNKRRG